METKKKPQQYQSQHKEELDQIYEKITTRKPFTFDLDENSLYQQYKNQYINLGRQAMADTQGKAAGLTGGYSTSYSQNVGQQAYNAYLEQLNQLVPELYAQAHSVYDREGQDLLDLYQLKTQQESADYSRWQDAYRNWLEEYGLAMQEQDRKQQQENWQKEFDSKQHQWQQEFDRDQAQALRNASAGGSRSGGGRSGGKPRRTFETDSDPYLYVLAEEWLRQGKGPTDRWRFLKAEGYPWEALAEFNRIIADLESEREKKDHPKAPPHLMDRVNTPY